MIARMFSLLAVLLLATSSWLPRDYPSAERGKPSSCNIAANTDSLCFLACGSEPKNPTWLMRCRLLPAVAAASPPRPLHVTRKVAESGGHLDASPSSTPIQAFHCHWTI